MKTNRGLFCLIGFCLCAGSIGGTPALAQGTAHTAIVAKVELVGVPVIVFDDKGAVATNLQKSDFRLTVDGAVQQILSLEKVRTPVSFVVVADLSDSMGYKIPFVQDSVLSLLDYSELEGTNIDEYSLVGFSTRVHLLSDFTHDQQDIIRRFPLLLRPMNGWTALFDAVYLGVATAKKGAANQRRAMVIVTDGGDNSSRYNLYQTRRLLEEAGMPVFAVMAGPTYVPLFQELKKHKNRVGSSPDIQEFVVSRLEAKYIGPDERRGPHNMSVLTEGTGGGVFTAKRVEDTPRIMSAIGLAVRHQYVLTFQAPHESGASIGQSMRGNEGNRHTIHIGLYPEEGFQGYSLPYYKNSFIDPE